MNIQPIALAATEASVRQTIKKIRGLQHVSILKKPNEMYIKVPKGKDDQAVSRLQRSKLVEMVSYIVDEP